MKNNKCFFIGHSDAPMEIYKSLLYNVEKLILEFGANEFIVGRYGNFDYMAARAVMELKRNYPSIILTLLLPFHPAERKTELPEGFDGSWYPTKMESVPKRAAIMCANKIAVECSQYLITYVRYPGSNSLEVVKYARGRTTIIEL